MKILWIDLNSSYAHASLALPAIHAQIKENSGIEWETVSCTINENVGMIVKSAIQYNPDIIAATAWLFNREILLHIVCRLKVLFPKSKVILGGPEFLGDNKDFLFATPFVDCVFRGEGEENVPRWLQVWDMPEQWLRRYFTLDKASGLYSISPEIRKNVIFRPFNLMDPIQFRLKFDVIFCRNVMIYFNQETRDALVRRFCDAMHPGGYFFISHSESLGQNPRFHLVAPSIYQKK